MLGEHRATLRIAFGACLVSRKLKFGIVAGFLSACVSPDETPWDDKCDPTDVEYSWQRIAAAAEIPGLQKQTTSRGVMIAQLAWINNGVALAYGDFDANTGPISIPRWLPARRQFEVSAPVPSEEVLRFDWIAQRWLTPNVDPVAHQGLGSFFWWEPAHEEWVEGPRLDQAVHVFSIAEYHDKVWISTGGLEGEAARIWSTDDFIRYTIEFELRAVGREYIRFDEVLACDGRLWMSGHRHGASLHPLFYTYENSRWIELQTPPAVGQMALRCERDGLWIHEYSGYRGKSGIVLRSFRPQNGALVQQDFEPVGLRAINWYVDVESAAQTSEWLLENTKSGEFEVWRRTDHALTPTWTKLRSLVELARTGERASTLLVRKKSLYVATESGSLYRASLVFEKSPSQGRESP